MKDKEITCSLMVTAMVVLGFIAAIALYFFQCLFAGCQW